MVQSIRNLRNLVPRFSLLPVSLSLSHSVGADRREPWERGWNLRTPASAEMNKRVFFSRRPLPSLPNPPPYFPSVPISPCPFRRLL